MKKIAINYLFFLISFSVYGQSVITDSLVHYLVEHSINEEYAIKLYKKPLISSKFWDNNKRKPLAGNYFSSQDLDFIRYQIENPAVQKWDKNKLKAIKKLKLIKRNVGTFPFFGFKARHAYYVYLPIFSKDMKTAVVFYDTWLKFKFYRESSGSGNVAVWRQENGKWRLIESFPIWLT